MKTVVQSLIPMAMVFLILMIVVRVEVMKGLGLMQMGARIHLHQPIHPPAGGVVAAMAMAMGIMGMATGGTTPAAPDR
jgi:hypothetical protein